MTQNNDSTSTSEHPRSKIQWDLFKFNIIWCGIAVGFGLNYKVYEALLLPPIISYMLLSYWFHQGIVIILDKKISKDKRSLKIGEILDKNVITVKQYSDYLDTLTQENASTNAKDNCTETGKKKAKKIFRFIQKRTKYRRNQIKCAFIANFFILPLLSLLLFAPKGLDLLHADNSNSLFKIYRYDVKIQQVLIIIVFIVGVILLVINFINIFRWCNYEYSYKRRLVKFLEYYFG